MAAYEMVHSNMVRSADEHLRVEVGRLPSEPPPGGVLCGWCHTFCTNKTQMWKHLREVHGDAAVLDCPYPGCGRRFPTVFRITAHIESHLKARGARVYTCELCGLECRHRVPLARHVDREHPESRDAMCGICSRYMGDVASLIEHMHDRHGAIMTSEPAGIGGPYLRPKRIVRCDVCGKRYVSDSAKSKHRRVHGLVVTDFPTWQRFPRVREMR